MIKNEEKPCRKISAKLSDNEIELCKAYIKGAVHGFCNTNKGEHFSVLSLFGGDNRLWYDTPLQMIYDYYERNKVNNEPPSKSAGKDVGRLLKIVLEKDKYNYMEINAFNNEYYKCD